MNFILDMKLKENNSYKNLFMEKLENIFADFNLFLNYSFFHSELNKQKHSNILLKY